MARNKQPEEVAKLKGADKKNPQRYRKKTPKNNKPIGDPPAHLEDGSKTVWKELVSNALTGVLTASDKYLMELASNLLAEYRLAPMEFPIGKYAALIGILSRFGMSPSDRQKLGMPPDGDQSNEFEDF